MIGSSILQLPLIYNGIKVWRLARPLQDLNVLLLEPLLGGLCCLGRVFLGHCHAGIPIHDPFSIPQAGFNALALTVHGPVHRPFDAVQLSCPLSRKKHPKYNVSNSTLDGGDGVLRVIGSIPPPNTTSWVDAKELDFGLIWPQHFHPVLLWNIGKLQTGLYMCFLEQGDLAGAAGFQSFTE